MKQKNGNNFITNAIIFIRDGRFLATFIILLAFSFPFYRIILPYFIWSIGVSWLLTGNLWNRFKTLWTNKYFLAILIFYLYHVIGLAYTEDMKNGIFNIMAKLSLIIFPMVFFSSGDIISKRKETIFSAFIWGIIISVIFCFIYAFYQAHIHTKDGSFFDFDVWNMYPDKSFIQLIFTGHSYLNHDWFSAFIHVNYFAMYITFAMYIIFQRVKSGKYNRYLYLALLLFLFITMVLVQSRASLIALFAVIIFEAAKYFVSPGKKIIKSVVVLVILLVIILLVFNSGRFRRIISNPEQISIEQLKANNVRLQVWEKSLDIIKGNILFGVGTGDADDMLKKQYTKELLDASRQKYLNVHNEFIETTMRLGVIGLLLLLGLIIFPLFLNRTDGKNYHLLVVFVILILIEFMFESMMVRLNGVTFFAFYYSLLNIKPGNVIKKTET